MDGTLHNHISYSNLMLFLLIKDYHLTLLVSIGLFIFLSFAASGKALGLYRSKITGVLRNRSTQSGEKEVDNGRNRSCSHEQFICHADEVQATKETHL